MNDRYAASITPQGVFRTQSVPTAQRSLNDLLRRYHHEALIKQNPSTQKPGIPVPRFLTILMPDFLQSPWECDSLDWFLQPDNGDLHQLHHNDSASEVCPALELQAVPTQHPSQASEALCRVLRHCTEIQVPGCEAPQLLNPERGFKSPPTALLDREYYFD